MSVHPSPRVQNVSEQIGDHMDLILRLFKPGRKITVLEGRCGRLHAGRADPRFPRAAASLVGSRGRGGVSGLAAAVTPFLTFALLVDAVPVAGA